MLIKEKDVVDSILSVVADKELRRIYFSIIYKPLAASEILTNTKVPHTSFYRKINWLLEKKLAIIDSIQETKDRKKYSMFRAVFDRFDIKIDGDDIAIEANPTVNLTEKTAMEFFTI